jgi:CRISPR-associated endonuclease/helicase Cas3
MPEQCRNLDPIAFTEYFRLFFQSVNDHGRADFEDYLVRNAGKAQFQFASAAAWYRLIDDGDSRSIIVWHEGPRFSSRRVLDELRRLGPNRLRMRRLQRCTVNVPTRVFVSLTAQHAVAEVEGPEGPTGIWAQCVPNLYDETFGLRLEGPQYDNIDFVC